MSGENVKRGKYRNAEDQLARKCSSNILTQIWFAICFTICFAIFVVYKHNYKRKKFGKQSNDFGYNPSALGFFEKTVERNVQSEETKLYTKESLVKSLHYSIGEALQASSHRSRN